MPITSSAKKALRASKRKRVFNVKRLKTMRDVVKDVKKLIAQKNQKEALSLLPSAYRAIDKAVKTGVMKKNTAARTKSRLTLSLNKAK